MGADAVVGTRRASRRQGQRPAAGGPGEAQRGAILLAQRVDDRRIAADAVFDPAQERGLAGIERPRVQATGIAGILGGRAMLDIVGDEDRRLVPRQKRIGGGHLHRAQHVAVHRAGLGQPRAQPVPGQSGDLGGRHRQVAQRRGAHPADLLRQRRRRVLDGQFAETDLVRTRRPAAGTAKAGEAQPHALPPVGLRDRMIGDLESGRRPAVRQQRGEKEKMHPTNQGCALQGAECWHGRIEGISIRRIKPCRLVRKTRISPSDGARSQRNRSFLHLSLVCSRRTADNRPSEIDDRRHHHRM